jgi:hypothetical protein
LSLSDGLPDSTGGTRFSESRRPGRVSIAYSGLLFSAAVAFSSYLVSRDWSERLGFRISPLRTFVGIHCEGLFAVVPLLLAGFALAVILPWVRTDQ